MFATGSLARRIEQAEASLITEGTAAAARLPGRERAFSIPVRGGVAAFTEPGSPLNKVAGLGFEGVPDASELAAIEKAYDERGCAVLVELSSFADPEIGRLLTRRGYELTGYENVSGLALQPGSAPTLSRTAWLPPSGGRTAPSGGRTPGLTITRVSDSESTAWLDAVITGFLHPDIYDGLASHESYTRDVVERATSDMCAVSGFERYLAWREETVAGGASFRSFAGVAQLCGSATLPEHRRRGVQSALLAHRLDEAARRGCDVAVVTTQPGSKSQENVERSGFTLLYVRAVLVRPAARSADAVAPA